MVNPPLFSAPKPSQPTSNRNNPTPSASVPSSGSSSSPPPKSNIYYSPVPGWRPSNDPNATVVYITPNTSGGYPVAGGGMTTGQVSGGNINVPSGIDVTGTTQQGTNVGSAIATQIKNQPTQSNSQLNNQIQSAMTSGDIKGYSGRLLSDQQMAKASLLNAVNPKSNPMPNQYGEYYKGTTAYGNNLLTQYNEQEKSKLSPSEQLTYNLPKPYEQGTMSVSQELKSNYIKSQPYQSLEGGGGTASSLGNFGVQTTILKGLNYVSPYLNTAGTIIKNQFENSTAIKIINAIPGQNGYKFYEEHYDEVYHNKKLIIDSEISPRGKEKYMPNIIYEGERYLISKGLPIPKNTNQVALFTIGGIAGAQFAGTNLGSKFFSSTSGKLFTVGVIFNNAITNIIDSADKNLLYQPTSNIGRFGKAVGQGAVIGQSSLLAGAYAGKLVTSLATNPVGTTESAIVNYPETLGFIVGGGLKVGFDKEVFIKTQKELLTNKKGFTSPFYRGSGESPIISISYDIPFKKSFNKIITPFSPGYKPVETNALGEQTIKNVKSSNNEEISLFNDKSTRVNNNVQNTFDIGLIPERGAELKFNPSLVNEKDVIPRSNPKLNPQNRFESVVLDITKQNKDVVGGSYAGNILFEGARKPGDVDIISKNPLKSANMIKDVLGKGTQVNPHQVNGIDVVAVTDIFGNKADIVSRKGYSSSRSFLGFGDLKTVDVEGVRVLNPKELLKKKVEVLSDRGLYDKKSAKTITDIQTYSGGKLNPDLNKATISGAYGHSDILKEYVGKTIKVAHSSTGFFSLFKNEKELTQTPEQLKASGGFTTFFGTPEDIKSGMVQTRVTRLGMEAGIKDLLTGDVTFKKGGKSQIIIFENEKIGSNTNKVQYGKNFNIIEKSSELEVGLPLEESPGVANILVKKGSAGVTLINGNKVDIIIAERKIQTLDLVSSKSTKLNTNLNEGNLKTFYHGTDIDSAKLIKEQGLQKGSWITSRKGVAEEYAWQSEESGKEGIVLEFKLDKKQYQELLPNENQNPRRADKFKTKDIININNNLKSDNKGFNDLSNKKSNNILSSQTLDLISKARKNELSSSQMNELSNRLTKETGVSYSRENKPYFSLNKLYSGIASLSQRSKSNKVSTISPSISSASISKSISSYSNPSSSISSKSISSISSSYSPSSNISSFTSSSSTPSSYSQSSFSRSISSSSRGSSRSSSTSYPSYPKNPNTKYPLLPNFNPMGKRKKLKRVKGISQPIAYTPSLGSSVFNIKLSNQRDIKSGKVSVFRRRGTLGIKELRKINQGSSIF